MQLLELAEIPPQTLPVARLAEHLRLGSGFADDAVQEGLLEGFLRAATAAIEGRCGKALVTRRFCLRLSEWGRETCHPIPVAPFAGLVTVTMTDMHNAVTNLPLDGFGVRIDGERPWLCAASGGALPRIPFAGYVSITFDAGYGATWDQAPADLRQAVVMLAAHYHDHRHDTGLGRGCMPFGVTALIERYRPIRLGAA